MNHRVRKVVLLFKHLKYNCSLLDLLRYRVFLLRSLRYLWFTVIQLLRQELSVHVHHDRMFSTLFLLADPLSCTTRVQISRAHTYSKTLHRGIFRSVKKSVSLLQTMVMFAMSSPYFFMLQLISCLSLTGCVQTTRLNTDGVPYIHNISPLLCVNINAYYWRKKNDSYCLSAIDFMSLT